MVYYLNCLVQEEPYRDPISVRIGERDTIGKLKRSIKAERSDLAHFGASELKLWRICKKIEDGKSPTFNNLTEDNKLLNIYEIGQIWSEPPFREFARLITLNCIVSGYDLENYCPITISIGEKVIELKSRIKLIEYVPEIEMQPLYTISKYFNANSYTYDPLCIHIMADKEFNEERMLEESVLDHYFWIDKFKGQDHKYRYILQIYRGVDRGSRRFF
ncbi:hypothetical protein C1646_661132 [Rhizophagus diaphanus]|nr:hypothetical protein C1646_661132 [Rhizophagus diaphanus] [Rhizophagus sp. MUCL 43196]